MTSLATPPGPATAAEARRGRPGDGARPRARDRPGHHSRVNGEDGEAAARRACGEVLFDTARNPAQRETPGCTRWTTSLRARPGKRGAGRRVRLRQVHLARCIPPHPLTSGSVFKKADISRLTQASSGRCAATCNWCSGSVRLAQPAQAGWARSRRRASTMGHRRITAGGRTAGTRRLSRARQPLPHGSPGPRRR